MVVLEDQPFKTINPIKKKEITLKPIDEVEQPTILCFHASEGKKKGEQFIIIGEQKSVIEEAKNAFKGIIKPTTQQTIKEDDKKEETLDNKKKEPSTAITTEKSERERKRAERKKRLAALKEKKNKTNEQPTPATKEKEPSLKASTEEKKT
eukprot:CAMPEP_0117426078 /NCGR_PEP_ID=MMETSP0758-20121206/6249_1 /TAXON_ID=63605 /ORGANISM="Percolomonas cosmopolitus, Strain AE-1 (ATCC 50343)" /LENGTH=150 /DNA_ID=CAMNT_0005211001 /DNA_START=164 /DNA_END=612 /DNA_ORIENTATION=-